MMGRIVLFLLLTILSGTAFGEKGPESFIKEGNDLFLKMDYEKALLSYGKGIEAFPDEPVLYYDRGNAYQKKGEYDKAVSDYQLAEKKEPRKILLKNIYFNLGNAYYARAEKMRNASKEQTEPLKEALAEYEKASDAYRKSLEIEREIAVNSNTDFSKIGTYAQKNMALTKEAWTETWEQIKLLERKNMKLEDGIENLLSAQMDLLPHLEQVYLHSANEEMLHFSLKTLAQYHVDTREEITYLRELADKEIERANAELENHKKSSNAQHSKAQQGQPPSSAGQGIPAQAPDADLRKLEDGLKNAKEIKKAVDQAAGLSEWVVEGLNTKKPLDAWKNNYFMIVLLKNLSDYLKKKDPVLSIYPLTIKEIVEAEILLAKFKQEPDTPEEEGAGGYDPPGLRMKKLAEEKADAAEKGFDFINKTIEEMLKKVGETQGAPGDKQGPLDQKQADDPYAAFFQTFDRKAAVSAFNRAKELNLSCEEGLKRLASQLLSEGGGTETKPVKDILEETLAAFNFYKTAPRPLIEIMVEVYPEVKKLNKTLDEKKGPEGVPNFPPFELLEVLVFKYALLLSDDLVGLLKDLGIERDALVKNQSALEGGYHALKIQKKMARDPKSAEGEETFRKESERVEDEVLKGLRLIAPEVAAALFFDAVTGNLETLLAKLPGTKENAVVILETGGPVKEDLTQLRTILSDYFKALKTRLEKEPDAANRERLLPALEHRKMALSYLERGSAQYEKMRDAYAGEKFLSGDFFVKDLKDTVDKARLIFSGKPDDAIHALKSAISYQKVLREASQGAIAITTQEGSASAISSYMTDNQKDIQMLSGIAAMKIREMGEKDEEKGPVQPGRGGQVSPGQACPQNQGIDPAKRDETLSLVQDAMVEEEKIRAFLEALEYHNTFDKHDLVIEKLEKALSILENKEDNKGKEQEKNKDEGENSKNKNEQEQNQQKQNNQNGGGQKEAKPLELTPDQARELLNELNKNDSGKKTNEAETGSALNVPRPW
jgi:hypothetical protein